MTSMSDVARVRGPAVRRRERRLRAFWRHEIMALKMAKNSANHQRKEKRYCMSTLVCKRVLGPTWTQRTSCRLSVWKRVVRICFSPTLRLLVTHNVAPTLAAPVYNQVNQEQILKACSRAPVFEYAPPAPATSDAHSQQLSRVYTTTTVTTDVNLDTIGLVYPKFPALLWSFFRHRSLVLSTF